MNRWHIVWAASIVLTVIMIGLWWLIPGFPLLIFLLFPPLFWWGSREGDEQHEEKVEEGSPPPVFRCPQCGKRLLEPLEDFCPRCGSRLRDQ